MIFLEYEIVDREKEQKWARKQARKYGLCLYSRWLFMLIGNLVLISLICSISAIIIFVNSPNDLTYQPLSFGRSCSTGNILVKYKIRDNFFNSLKYICNLWDIKAWDFFPFFLNLFHLAVHVLIKVENYLIIQYGKIF